MRTMAVALAVLVLAGCRRAPRAGGGHAAPGSTALGAPWSPSGRREATALHGRATARVTLSPGGSAARFEAAATGDAGPGGVSTTRIIALRRGEPVGTTAAVTLEVSPAGEASWSPVMLELPPGADAVELSADAASGVTTWISGPVRVGLAPSGARSVLLVSLDTVRADAISCLGQSIPTTPRLDALAARGTLFTQAIAPASWTLPSHVSVMTGLMPSWHGRTDVRRRDVDLPPVVTLARILGARGWETAAFTGTGAISWLLGPTRGFRLVKEHDMTPRRRWLHPFTDRECDSSALDAVRWLEARARLDVQAEPFFLFWHSYEAHWPYVDDRHAGSSRDLPAGIPENARADWERYLGDLSAEDAALGTILDALARLGLAGSTDVVVFSDHGEEFGEHSGGRRSPESAHGYGSWETLLHVPLVVVSPTVPPGRRDDLVTLLDVFPTVLLCAGVQPPPSQGRPLQEAGGHEDVMAEALYASSSGIEEKTVRTQGLKYVVRLASPPKERLTELATDPGETADATASRPEDVAALRARAAAFFGAAPAETAVRQRPRERADALPDDVRQALRSLGYVEAGGP